MAHTPGKRPPARIQIEQVAPLLDAGRYPVKRTVGESVAVSADIFRDGHEVLRAVVRWRAPGKRRRGEAPLHRVDAGQGGDRWEGVFGVDELGTWRFEVEAWSDPVASWLDELTRKANAGDAKLSSELAEGALLLEAAARRAKGDAARTLAAAAAAVARPKATEKDRIAAALDPAVAAASHTAPVRDDNAIAGPFDVLVDRERARFGAWYELFPRSWGGLRGVEAQIPALAELGFDVLYLPPIHPIGLKNRKGANNAPKARKADPGSPWAIGRSGVGGHDVIDPGLGTIDDFDALVATARAHDIDIALDFAIQCSADHPWLTEHPEWFQHRPDGTLKFAENPPKRYQDIYNVNWDSPDWRALWQALLDVVLHWVRHGVRVFRVDNPHTKPLPFWEWLIAEVRREAPDVIFLAEAFTRAAMMRTLAKLGFDQSYTYFTWKNATWELREYVSELAHSGMEQYYRPNFFANTPDILHAYLVQGGRPAFTARLVLAATLSPTYGIYSGFENAENVPVREDSEEYLDSEKYEVRTRALDGPLLPMIGALNAARRANPALQQLSNVTFLDAANDGLLAYGKTHEANTVVCVVNVDPHFASEGLVVVPAALGTAPAFTVTDALTGARFDWRIGGNYVRLEPGASHVLVVGS